MRMTMPEWEWRLRRHWVYVLAAVVTAGFIGQIVRWVW